MNPSPIDLDSEINSLRRVIQWLDDAFAQAESLDQRLRITAALSQASAQIGRLSHIQAILKSGRSSELDGALHQVIQDLAREWDVHASAQAPPPSLACAPDPGSSPG